MTTAVGEIRRGRQSVALGLVDDDGGLELIVLRGELVHEYVGRRRHLVGMAVRLDASGQAELRRLLDEARDLDDRRQWP